MKHSFFILKHNI